jgi:hypothetical protein
MVPKVRSSLRAAPPSPGTSTHAATTFLCTSNPQHRSWTTCIVALLASATAGRGAHLNQNLVCALPARARQSVVPRGTRVQLLDGLAAPRLLDLATRPSAPPVYRASDPFSSSVVPAAGMSNC